MTPSIGFHQYMVNFPGVDSVLGQNGGKLFIIQATIADDHKSPKEGMNKVCGRLSTTTLDVVANGTLSLSQIPQGLPSRL